MRSWVADVENAKRRGITKRRKNEDSDSEEEVSVVLENSSKKQEDSRTFRNVQFTADG